MKNRINSHANGKRKRANVIIICGALVVALGTCRMVFAATLATNALQVNANTKASSSIVKNNDPEKYAVYNEYGLTYNLTTGNLYYNDKLVRYFEDYFPINENYAGTDYFNENGIVDVRAVRDFAQIVRNADGSIDPSGRLLGVEPLSQSEFDARDLEKLKNPQQITVYAGEAVSTDDSQTPAQTSAYSGEATSTDKRQTPTQLVAYAGDPMTPDELAKEYAIYEPFGVTYDKTQDRLYYNGKSVRIFWDTMGSNGESLTGGQFSGSARIKNSADGEIDISVIRDFSELDGNGYGKLVGIEVME